MEHNFGAISVVRMARFGRAFGASTTCLVSAFLSSNAAADNLRILDQRGLVRAQREVRSEADVVVTLKQPLDKPATVSNIDGIAGEVAAEKEGVTLVFRGLKEGTWRLDIDPAVVTEVRIR
jgi:hypothetical protein